AFVILLGDEIKDIGAAHAFDVGRAHEFGACAVDVDEAQVAVENLHAAGLGIEYPPEALARLAQIGVALGKGAGHLVEAVRTSADLVSPGGGRKADREIAPP